MLRYLVVPVVAFSVIAVSLIVTLDELQQHERGLTTAIAPLWGAGVTVFILILALCWIAFGMAPSSASKFMFAGREAALLVGPIVVGLTIAAAATMPLINMALNRVDIDFSPLEPGALLYSVLLPTAAVIGLVAAVEGWQVTARKGDRSNSESKDANHGDAGERAATKVANLKFAMEAGIMCVAGAVGLVLGAPHIVDTVLTAARGR